MKQFGGRATPFRGPPRRAALAAGKGAEKAASPLTASATGKFAAASKPSSASSTTTSAAI